MFGVDNTFLSRAVDGEVFEPYEAEGLDAGARRSCASSCRTARRRRSTSATSASTTTSPGSTSTGWTPPADLAALADPAYRDLLVVENPATSSPGLAFLLATIAEFGEDGWVDYWSRLRDNGVEVVDGWDGGVLRAVLRGGGGAAPARRQLRHEPAGGGGLRRPADRRGADRRASRRPASARSSSPACSRGTDAPDEARRLVDFLVSDQFQTELPLNLFVYPANGDVALPAVFTSTRPLAADPATLDPATISDEPGGLDRRRGPTPSCADPPSGRDPYRRDPSRKPRRIPPGSVPRWLVPGSPRVRRCSSPSSTSGRSLTLLGRGLPATSTLGRATTWDIAWFTLWQAVASTVLTIALGLLPAYVLARYRFPGRRLLAGLLTAAFVLPTVVMGAAILALLPSRLERGVPAILAAHVVFNLAVVVRTVGAVWDHLPARPRGSSGDARRLAGAGVPGDHPALARPAILAAGVHRVRVHVHVVRRDPRPRRCRHVHDRGRDLAAGDAARRRRRRRHAGRRCSWRRSVPLVAWSAWQQRRHSRALALRPLARRRRPRTGRERRLVAAVALATGAIVVAPLARARRALAARQYGTHPRGVAQPGPDRGPSGHPHRRRPRRCRVDVAAHDRRRDHGGGRRSGCSPPSRSPLPAGPAVCSTPG